MALRIPRGWDRRKPAAVSPEYLQGLTSRTGRVHYLVRLKSDQEGIPLPQAWFAVEYAENALVQELRLPK